MAFPSEQTQSPFGGPPSIFNQLRHGSVPLNPGPGPPLASGTQHHYAEMTAIPTSLYGAFMNTVKEHLENVESNEALKHIELARSHANNPNAFKYHMGEADRYHTVANSKNINDMIRNKLTDTELAKIDQKISTLRKGKLNNPDTMRQLQQLQIERNTRKNILMQNETAAYNRYLSDPFSSLHKPQTLPENHAQRSLRQFLMNNQGVISPNPKGHLVIEGKTLSTTPGDIPRLVHYLTKDIHGPPPPGTDELLAAMRKRGFDVQHDIGNTFLKDRLRLNNQIKAQRQKKIPPAKPPRPAQFPAMVPYSFHASPSSRSTLSTASSLETPPSSPTASHSGRLYRRGTNGKVSFHVTPSPTSHSSSSSRKRRLEDYITPKSPLAHSTPTGRTSSPPSPALTRARARAKAAAATETPTSSKGKDDRRKKR
eukprot:Seg2628.10 transcript_id=Seg2628.10/GoldUCD/mRNA.D3Y31 product="hypothetical protein" protein_id=Seg2628.10/GoldUCD/D3Y31